MTQQARPSEAITKLQQLHDRYWGRACLASPTSVSPAQPPRSDAHSATTQWPCPGGWLFRPSRPAPRWPGIEKGDGMTCLSCTSRARWCYGYLTEQQRYVCGT